MIKLFLALNLALFGLASSRTFILQMVQNVNGCRGGEACDLQPSVQVIDKATQQIEFSFQGDVFAQLSDTPSGYESLYLTNSCDLNGCGKKVVNSLAKATFVSGQAKFNNLTLTAAGAYTIRFIGRKQNGESFAEVFSPTFEVTVG
eukprot:gene12906-14896_t